MEQATAMGEPEEEFSATILENRGVPGATFGGENCQPPSINGEALKDALRVERVPVPPDGARLLELLHNYVTAREELKEFLLGDRRYESALRTLSLD